ncbi:hypothetical protein HZA26_00520 [Candidatus Nomurabacteria bacterium]|nr:hypothetical protein [Candidatus Nomurabacteria bacterium]
MKQVNLKIRGYGGGMSIIDNNNLKDRMLSSLFVSFGVLGLFYVLILGNMIFNISERRNLEAEARVLSNEVLDLELTYLNLSEKVDFALAESLGFKEAKASFATRKPLTSIKFAKNDL